MADWKRLKELYQLAEQQPAGARAAFLESACGGDKELLREVQGLLAAGDAAGSFLESAPDILWEARAAAMAGTAVGHYRLENLLGRGGMGLVYRATDLRLARTVAVKLLRPEMASTPEARRRFLREAKAASALKHPNIVTIHDADLADGRDFLVMEFVDGQTLAEILSSGPMPYAMALDCAIQVVRALEAAHGAGILHRDLKPQNVMLDASGNVKVVDFGLAKLNEHPAPGQSQALETHTGVVMGTAAYMSPEQAEGKATDARSDLFSFGALLYQILSGRRAFSGGSPAATLAAVLRDHPKPLDSAAWPVVSRCLEKDPARRFQTARELHAALQAVSDGKNRISRKSMRIAAAALAVALLIAGAVFTSRLPRTNGHAPPRSSLVQLTKDSGLTTEPALSPDGRTLAYASDRGSGTHLDIWAQPVDGGAATRLTDGIADQHEPAFSPDGARICYRNEQDGGGIWTIPVSGGEPKLLMRSGRRPRYSPDGKWIACWTGMPGTGDPAAPGASGVFIVPAAGGEPRQLQPGFGAARFPVWAPDGRHILFAGAPGGDLSQYDWWVAGLNGGPPVRTGARHALLEGRLTTNLTDLSDPAEWQAETGSILFSTRRSRMPNLWKVPISPRDWKVSGSAVRLTLGSGTDDYPTAAGGRIAFAGLTSRSNIWSIQNGNLKALTEGSTLRYMPSISAGGDFLVFLQRDGVLARDLRSGVERELLAENEPAWARLMPDGSRVFYSLDKTLYSVPRTGGSAKRHLDAIEKPWDISPDGTKALAMAFSAPRAVLLLDLRTGRRTTFLSHPSWNLYWAAFSADGERVAFTAKTGPERSCVFAVPFHNGAPPGPSEWLPVTDGAGADTAPRWSPDGKRLYFFSDRDGFRCIWFVEFENGRPSIPIPLRHFHNVRQSLSNGSVSLLELAVSRDRVVFDLDELAGNIWLAQ